MDKELLPIIGMLLGGGGLGVLTADEERMINPTAAIGGALAGFLAGEYLKNNPYLLYVMGINRSLPLGTEAAKAAVSSIPLAAIGLGGGSTAGYFIGQKQMKNVGSTKVNIQGKPTRLYDVPLDELEKLTQQPGRTGQIAKQWLKYKAKGVRPDVVKSGLIAAAIAELLGTAYGIFAR